MGAQTFPVKMFLAGVSAAVPPHAWNRYAEFLTNRSYQVRELLSYVEIAPDAMWRRVMEKTATVRCELFLDSGAFSAWTRGLAIDLKEYAQFVLDRRDAFSIVANLDVIPGSWGHIPTQQEINESAARGWENYWALKKLLAPSGLVPMHIYHQGEDIKWLKKLMDEADYFGVSPGNDRSTDEKLRWLDEVFTLLTDDKGWPLRKTHGFGVTAMDLLFRYPWYSCDSTAWVLTGRYGMIYVPLNGKAHKVYFSNQSPKQQMEGQHYLTHSKPEQAAIRTYIEEKGFTVEGLADDYVQRDLANIQFFLELEKLWEPRPFKRSEIQPSFF